LSNDSSAATVRTPSGEILVPFATDPVPSLVELTVHIIPRPPDALNRRLPPANTDDKLFSDLIDKPKSDPNNVRHPVATRTNITKRKNNPEYFFIFFIIL
jgi:hypothetical protein